MPERASGPTPSAVRPAQPAGADDEPGDRRDHGRARPGRRRAHAESPSVPCRWPAGVVGRSAGRTATGPCAATDVPADVVAVRPEPVLRARRSARAGDGVGAARRDPGQQRLDRGRRPGPAGVARRAQQRPAVAVDAEVGRRVPQRVRRLVRHAEVDPQLHQTVQLGREVGQEARPAGSSAAVAAAIGCFGLVYRARRREQLAAPLRGRHVRDAAGTRTASRCDRARRTASGRRRRDTARQTNGAARPSRR